MAATIAVKSNRLKLTEDGRREELTQPVVAVMFIERGKTDKYGWLAAFDELSDYLGRLS